MLRVTRCEFVHNLPCEQVSNRLTELEAENAKLRELCRRYGEYVSQDRCEGCVYKTRCNNGLIDECWQRGEIRDLARELGIEATA